MKQMIKNILIYLSKYNKRKEWRINESFDLYNLDKNEIISKNIYRGDLDIFKGQTVIADDIEYFIIDYLEFCNKTNQVVLKIKNK